MTVDAGRWSVLGRDGRALVVGLKERAARALKRWIGHEVERGADEEEVKQVLREQGAATQTDEGPLRADPVVLEQLVEGQERPETWPPPMPTEEPVETRLEDPVVLLQEGRILDGTIAQLEEALATGALDDELPSLLEHEAAGKDRKGAREAIEHRQQALLCLSVLDGTLADLDRLIATGACDDHIDAMVRAEKDGKARKGAFERLERLRDA